MLSLRAKRSNPWCRPRHCEPPVAPTRDRCARLSIAPRKRKNGLLRRIRLRPKAGFGGRVTPRNDVVRPGSIEAFSFSRHGVPEGCQETALPSSRRGRRESRMRAALAVSCANCAKESAHEHTGPAEAIRLSLRNGFNAYFRALPGDRAFLTPSPRGLRFCPPGRVRKTSARLDANH